MDPNEALKIIRREVGKILDENDGMNPETLAETVRGLDGWLSKGGAFPDDWARNVGIHRRAHPNRPNV